MKFTQPFIIFCVASILAISALVPAFWVIAATTSPATTTNVSSTTTPVAAPVITTPPIDTTKVILSSIAQTRITNLAANVSNRLDATLRRLTNVHGRITSRIDKLAQAGVNTDAAATEQQIAANHLETAKRSLSTIDREVTAFIGSNNPRAGYLRLKATYTTIYTELTLAHSSLRLTLNKLDGTIIAPTATSTASTTNPL